MTIDENIKRYRVRKHMTQADLAKAIGSTVRMIQRYEAPEDTSNSVIPSVPILRKIAKVLEVNVSDIIEDDSSEKESLSIRNFYDTLTRDYSDTDMKDVNRARVENFLLFNIFKTIYYKYELNEHTEVDAFNFYFSDSSFSQFLYDQFASIVIGSVTQNLIKIKLGKNKPLEESKVKLKTLKEDIDLDSLFFIFHQFNDSNKVHDFLKYTVAKIYEYNSEDNMEILRRLDEVMESFNKSNE